MICFVRFERDATVFGHLCGTELNRNAGTQIADFFYIMMRRRHIVAVGRILAVLLLLANSGFTMVLHSCLMGSSRCAELPMGMGMHGKAQSQSSGMELATLSVPCCAVTVAGGINDKPVTTERTAETGIQKSAPVAEMPLLHDPGEPGPDASSRFLSYAAERVAPHPVEKYILNAAFLI